MLLMINHRPRGKGRGRHGSWSLALILIMNALCLRAFASTENPNRMLELRAHEESLRYAKEGLPRHTIGANWLTGDKKDLLHASSPRQFRHMHAMRP